MLRAHVISSVVAVNFGTSQEVLTTNMATWSSLIAAWHWNPLSQSSDINRNRKSSRGVIILPCLIQEVGFTVLMLNSSVGIGKDTTHVTH
jgi:hypothetical protein